MVCASGAFASSQRPAARKAVESARRGLRPIERSAIRQRTGSRRSGGTRRSARLRPPRRAGAKRRIASAGGTLAAMKGVYPHEELARVPAAAGCGEVGLPNQGSKMTARPSGVSPLPPRRRASRPGRAARPAPPPQPGYRLGIGWRPTEPLEERRPHLQGLRRVDVLHDARAHMEEPVGADAQPPKRLVERGGIRSPAGQVP